MRDPAFRALVEEDLESGSLILDSRGAVAKMRQDLAGDVGRGATVSDALEGLTGVDYPLGPGHGADYHGGPGNTAIEFFAEVVDSKVCNPAALGYAREVFPNGVAAVEGIIGGMLDD